jgi:hypothetical protein
MSLASTSQPSKVSCFFIVRCKKFSAKLHTVDTRRRFRGQLNCRVMSKTSIISQSMSGLSQKVVDPRYHDYKYCRNCSKAGMNVCS